MSISVSRFIVPACFVLFALAAFAFSPFVADDAHIVGRYALNAADGFGLVYNVGERVSALTSPLHALLVSVVALFTSDPVSAYRFAAPLLPMLGVFAAIRILRSEATEAAIICAFGLASPFLALWSVGGLETPIMATIMVIYAAILLKVYRARDLTARDCLTLGALLGFGFLTRFDSILVTLPPLLALTVHFWRKPALWAGAALALAIAGSWLGFAHLYYGDILPTSFYTKVIADRVSDSISVMVAINFVILSGLIFLVPLMSTQREECHPFARTLILGVMVSIIGFMIFALRNSGMHMMFGYRYFVPFIPAIGILLAATIHRFRGAVAPVLFAGQGALAAFIFTTSINPHVVEEIGPIGPGYFEYAGMTPADYGHFIATLQQDAEDLRAHWQATGRSEEEPVIGMHTGGMGYWLRDFRAVEILVSYRHDCELSFDEVLAIPDYVQGINFVRHSALIRSTFLDGAENPETFGRSELDGGIPWVIDYAYRSNGGDYVYPAQTHGPCVEPETRLASGE